MVQLRAFIERARPIDKQLAYQIEKLLRTTDGVRAAVAEDLEAAAVADQLDGSFPAPSAPAAADEDALRYRPNPAALVTKAPVTRGPLGDGVFEGEEGAAGVYRPPKLNPVAMEEDLEASRQERRRQMEMKRRAKRR